jgi:hypothetical protein
MSGSGAHGAGVLGEGFESVVDHACETPHG